ncbi:YaiI/YqxD family protein [Sediminibacillus massiliensis]|uniref:YaiI/YqxD family protein n=1 Tax=Sediminibacillus massiliensis TaxID=1926277 RepID=UPI0009886831|nr:DUF188 domain-containing protein [Sediminibacillus massiliensis]
MLYTSLNVFVDADSCPVKEEISKVASMYGLTVHYVASYNHVGSLDKGSNWHIVDTGDQAVDYFILNKVRQRDIVITQDLSLAALVVSRGVYALTPRGNIINEGDSEEIFLRKYLRLQNQKQKKRVKGPSKLTKEDKKNFLVTFEKILSKIEGFS